MLMLFAFSFFSFFCYVSSHFCRVDDCTISHTVLKYLPLCMTEQVFSIFFLFHVLSSNITLCFHLFRITALYWYLSFICSLITPIIMCQVLADVSVGSNYQMDIFLLIEGQ